VGLVQGSFKLMQELPSVRCAIGVNDTTQSLS
jgi:hypothetical protein